MSAPALERRLVPITVSRPHACGACGTGIDPGTAAAYYGPAVLCPGCAAKVKAGEPVDVEAATRARTVDVVTPATDGGEQPAVGDVAGVAKVPAAVDDIVCRCPDRSDGFSAPAGTWVHTKCGKPTLPNAERLGLIPAQPEAVEALVVVGTIQPADPTAVEVMPGVAVPAAVVAPSPVVELEPPVDTAQQVAALVEHGRELLAADAAVVPPLDERPADFDGTDCPDLSALADVASSRGGDPDVVAAELIDVYKAGILAADVRGRQKEIGPSEIGHPCDRCIAYKLAGVEPTGTQQVPWRQRVGTLVHADGDVHADLANQQRGMRWYTNIRVNVGELYPGRPITGTLDYYDVETATVIDLKVPGSTAMKTYGRGKPESPQYRIQGMLYGRGVVRAGAPVDVVGILRVSPAKELDDYIFKWERFDEQVAVDALTRAGGIARMVDALGPGAAPLLSPTDHYCHRCDYFRAGSTDLRTGCPGAPGTAAPKPRRSSLDDLVD